MTPTTPPAATPAYDPDELIVGVDPAPLFGPVEVAGMKLANRFVYAPMTRMQSPYGVPTSEVAAYYARRAPHFGLLITEATYVGHPSSGSSARVPQFYGEAALAGWAAVADEVHAAGGLIVPQLWHLGVQRLEGAPPEPQAPVVSPSGLDLDGTAKGKSASEQDIADIIAAFAQAAADAQRLGFDGVEIHGAHGYLLDQFFWHATNQRTDGYGGDVPGRSRMAVELVAAVRAAVGPDFPILFRFSQWKSNAYDAQIAQTPAELEQLLAPLVSAGVDVLDVSTRRYWQHAFEGSPRTLAGWAKHVSGLPTIAIGSVGVQTQFRGAKDEPASPINLGPLLRLFSSGEYDLIAVGRAALSDPAWTSKLRDRRVGEIRQYQKSHEREPLF